MARHFVTRDNGKVVTLVTSLLGAFTPFYAAYVGTKAPVEHLTRAASKEFVERGISVTTISSGPMDAPFFYPTEGADAVAYHKTAAALSNFSKTGLTDIKDIVPFIRFPLSVLAKERRGREAHTTKVIIGPQYAPSSGQQ